MSMPEQEFAQLTFAGFRQLTAAQQKATVDRMSKAQYARWLDRCVPPQGRQSRDSFTANVYRSRMAR